MRTIVPSPARKAGLLKFQSSGRPTASSWMKFHVGDTVREKEGRHEGRVEAIWNSSEVKVRWDDSGWIEYLDMDQLELVR